MPFQFSQLSQDRHHQCPAFVPQVFAQFVRIPFTEAEWSHDRGQPGHIASRLRHVRGQLTYLPPIEPLRCVVLRGGLVLPPVDGITVTGASFDLEDTDASVRTDSHEGNLERLESIIPGAAAGLDAASLQGRTAFRSVARDRLPLIGPLEGAAALYGAFAYGSRGLLWAGLGAELLASRMEGEPLPLEAPLAGALDPGRFALRARRRAGSRGSRP